MEKVKTQHSKIVNYKTMKQSGLVRIELELNKDDSVRFCGTLAVAEANRLLANLELNFTEIEGENNGFEKQIEKAVTPPKEKPYALNIYQKFRLTCIDYSGTAYYEKVKKALGVNHIKELLIFHPEHILEDALRIQISYWEEKTKGILFMVNKQGQAYGLWQTLFSKINK